MKTIPIGEVKQDEFGRYHGVLLVNKPAGITSHDVVDLVRKKYETRKVGHAGTLDPFAEGLLILLIGNATGHSDAFLGLGKTYEAKVLHGISTWTSDPEGELKTFATHKIDLDIPKYKTVLESFIPGYRQVVPLYSSVKVNGDKLRVLVRKYPKKQIIENNGEKIVLFRDENNKLVKEVPIPIKSIKISDIKLLGGLENLLIKTEEQLFSNSEKAIEIVENEIYVHPNIKRTTMMLGIEEFVISNISVSCSKGTYIRQLSEDIGDRLDLTPSMLIALKRKTIGNFKLEDAIDLDQLIKS